MRYMRSLLIAFGLTSLVAGIAVAGVNPGNPGLPYPNNRSAICTDCHTVAPGGAAAHYGSHFVFNPRNPATGTTNSGGGWGTAGTNSRLGTRNGGEYFKVTQWGGVGGNKWSKYGGEGADNQSYAGGSDNATRGAANLDATESNYSVREIICESCHNVVSNVAGGNNLVAPISSATYTTGIGDNVQNANPLLAASVDTPLCIGCHGYMYAANDNNTATNATRYGDTRNGVYSTVVKKQNNSIHSINGVNYPQNHHVGTGDTFNTTQAAAGLLWRDVLVVEATASGMVDTTLARGQVPQLPSWVDDGSGKPTGKSGTTLNCMHCHSLPHSGLSGTGASILRDANADITMPAAGAGVTLRQEATARLGETLGGATRTWMGFSDVQFCNDCHGIK